LLKFDYLIFHSRNITNLPWKYIPTLSLKGQINIGGIIESHSVYKLSTAYEPEILVFSAQRAMCSLNQYNVIFWTSRITDSGAGSGMASVAVATLIVKLVWHRHTNNLKKSGNTKRESVHLHIRHVKILWNWHRNNQNINKCSPAAAEGFRLRFVLKYHIGLHMYAKVKKT